MLRSDYGPSSGNQGKWLLLPVVLGLAVIVFLVCGFLAAHEPRDIVPALTNSTSGSSAGQNVQLESSETVSPLLGYHIEGFDSSIETATFFSEQSGVPRIVVPPSNIGADLNWLAAKTFATPANTTPLNAIDATGLRYPNPRDFCNKVEKLLNIACTWSADFLQYSSGEKVIKISIKDASGNQLARIEAQYLNVSEYFTGLPQNTYAWLTYVEVATKGLGFGKLAAKILDGAIVRVATFAGLERTVLFVDSAGWGVALMSKLPPELVTRINQTTWFYIPPG